MRFESATATSSGQIANRPDQVLAIEFHARSDNTGSVIAGHSASTASSGRELVPGEQVAIDFDPGSIPLSDFYAVITNSGDGLDWTVILR